MDGVLAVWNDKASEEETHEEGYFISRTPDASAVAFTKKLSKRADVAILSSVYEDDHSAKEKALWLEANGLGDIERIFVPYGKDKFEYVKRERGRKLFVLIDDYSKNLIAWEQADPDNISIKYMNGINDRPRATFSDDGNMNFKFDTWDSYRIDHRMLPMQMLYTVVGITTMIEEDVA